MTRKRAVLLSQGDEVITGQTLDSNSAWLAEQLTTLGFDLVLQLTVADRVPDIAWALELGCERGDVLICTGGLGPTQDDLTVEVVAQLTQDELTLDQASLDHIQGLYKSISRVMPPANIKQAMLPSRATILQNDWGTAPGLQIEHDQCQAYFVPGVPREMRALWKQRGKKVRGGGDRYLLISQLVNCPIQIFDFKTNAIYRRAASSESCRG